jgi:Cd2+/Zn2+-exporting ATPase
VEEPPLQKTTLRIEKMDCPTEEALIRKRLGAMPEVESMSFDLVNRKLTVNHAPTALPAVQAALSEVGMQGVPDTPAIEAAQAATPVAKKPWAVDHWKLLLGGAFALAAELCALAFGDISVPAAVLSVAAIFLSGVDTYRKGLIALRHKTLNINALMAIAVTGAVLIGQWPEAAMVMFLFGVAEAIESLSLERARRAVQSLMSMAPETATVRSEQGWASVPVSQVAIGAVVRVRPDERIPVDGVVTAGASSVDQAPITGESIPVDKSVGDPLYAGTVNQNAEMEYRTTAAASDSTLARIVRTVQEAQASRAPTQRFVDKFAAWYTPAVVAIAIAAAVIPPLFMGGEWMTWVYRALVMLVVACPCALVISTPVTVVSGLTAAARRGILIKGGKFLEEGYKLKVMALDKTGTLTRGKPAVTDFIPLVGQADEQLRKAAALSSRSDHPVSRAVTAYAQNTSGRPEVTGFAALQGRGVEGDIAGKRHQLGNHRLVEQLGACSPALEARLSALEEQGKTVIVLMSDNTPQAVIGIADTLRPESAEAVAQLKQLGVRPIMLTGDNSHTARTIARQVGIDDVRSELLPEDKLAAISELQAGGVRVGMVGDGGNDTPALALAAVGFSMGAGGTDAAIETADVALMDDDPRKLAAFIRLSRSTKSILWQNIVLALGIKVVFLVLTFAGEATLWMAVFADMGTSLFVVFNGMRLLRWGDEAPSRHALQPLHQKTSGPRP